MTPIGRTQSRALALVVVLIAACVGCGQPLDTPETIVPHGLPVSLDAAPLIDIERYSEVIWTVEGPPTSQASAASPGDFSTSFVPDLAGRYVVTLEGRVEAAVTRRQLVFLADNEGPLLTLAAEERGLVGQRIGVAASTVDVNNDNVDVTWRVQGPEGGDVPVAEFSNQTVAFVPALVGQYKILAEASDGVIVDNAEVEIEVRPAARVIETLASKPPFIAYASAHHRLVYVENVGQGNDVTSNIVFLDVDTGDRESIALDEQIRRISIDADEATVVAELHYSLNKGFALVDIASRTLTKLLLISTPAESIMRNAGSGVILYASYFSLKRIDLLAETTEHVSLVDDLFGVVFAQNPMAIYGTLFDGAVRWYDAQGPAVLAGTTEMPLPVPEGCFRDMVPLDGGDIIFMNGKDLYATNQQTSVTSLGSLPVTCSRVLHEQVATGQLATAPIDPEDNTTLIWPAPEFAVIDLQSRALLGTYYPALVENEIAIPSAFQDVFLTADGEGYIALMARNYNVDADFNQQEEVSFVIVAGEL